MKGRRRMEQATAMAAVLANPLRCQIIEQLRRGPCIVGDLVKALGESQATVSKQLAALREAGLLACRPDGRCREYALANPGRVADVIDALQALGRDASSKAARYATYRAQRDASPHRNGL